MPEASQSKPVYVLVPVNGGYKIEKRVQDHDFDPPIWISAGFLNDGHKFASRGAARAFMVSEHER